MRIVYTVALAGLIGTGLAYGNSVSYFYGSTPTLMNSSGDNGALGSQNVSFVSHAPVVSSASQAIWSSDAGSAYATVSYASGGSTYGSSGSAVVAKYGSQSGSGSTSTYSYSSPVFKFTGSGGSNTSPSYTWSSSPSSLYSSITYGTTGYSGISLASKSYSYSYSPKVIIVTSPTYGYSYKSGLSPMLAKFASEVKRTPVYTNVASLNVKPGIPTYSDGIFTPEPGGIVLVLGGLGVLFAFRRRLAR